MMNNLIPPAVNRSSLTYVPLCNDQRSANRTKCTLAHIYIVSVGSLNFDYRLNDHQALLVAILYHYLRNGITA